MFQDPIQCMQKQSSSVCFLTILSTLNNNGFTRLIMACPPTPDYTTKLQERYVHTLLLSLQSRSCTAHSGAMANGVKTAH